MILSEDVDSGDADDMGVAVWFVGWGSAYDMWHVTRVRGAQTRFLHIQISPSCGAF